MRVSTRRSSSIPTFLLAAGLALAGTACGEGGGGAASAVDRETFVATYVDLRLSALGTPTGEVADAERQRVLGEHGVSEDDLMSFADAYGGDPEFMRGVWEDVQRRLKAAAGEDTTADGGGPR